MIKTKITVLSAIAVAMLGLASPVAACACEPSPPEAGNPGNGKYVGNSPWDGITGNSGRNGVNAPSAGPMHENDQDDDTSYPQPGGKDETGPSNANKD